MVYNVRAKNKRKAHEAIRHRCWLNDRELDDCFYADTRRHLVKMYARDADGHLYLDHKTGEPAIVVKRGRVRVRRDDEA
jgi:hypothetical protein